MLTLHRRSVLIGIGVTCLNAVAFYLLLSYMPTYLSNEMGMSERDSFIASTVSLATYIGLIFLMGRLSDRFGRKPMLVVASLLFLGLTVPLFSLLDHQPLLVILAIQILFGAMLAMNDGTLPCLLAEIFPTRVRFSGFALSFNIANALFGGTAPFIATWLIRSLATSWPRRATCWSLRWWHWWLCWPAGKRRIVRCRIDCAERPALPTGRTGVCEQSRTCGSGVHLRTSAEPVPGAAGKPCSR